MNLRDFKKDQRFAHCPNAFLAWGTQSFDEQNRLLLAKDQTGYWDVAEDRINIGDLIFLCLPHPTTNSKYPYELFAGVLKQCSEENTLFHVEKFYALFSIDKSVLKMMGIDSAPTGNKIYDIWRFTDPTLPIPIPDEDEDERAYPEGAEKYRIHKTYERQRKLVNLVKQKRLDETKVLRCDVCAFDFYNVYGEHGKGFIEAHHLNPVSKLNESAMTRVEDFALVCSNCHKMLHRGEHLISPVELQELIKSAST